MITLHPILLTRSCRYPLQAEMADYWDDLKHIIQTVAPELHKEISDRSYREFEHLNPKIQLSLFKYFNRVKYRATPYGNLSAISAWKIAKEDTSKRIFHQTMELQHKNDWSLTQTNQTQIDFNDSELNMRTQATLYQEENEYYFYRLIDQQFELSSLSVFPELQHIIQHFQQTSTYQIFSQTIPENEQELYQDLISQLIELQVLNHGKQPNLTGEDFFQRTSQQTNTTTAPYTIAHRKTIQGSFQPETYQSIGGYLNFLQQHMRHQSPADLQQFCKNFQYRYENTWQKLTTVLDPIHGIGYGNIGNQQPSSIQTLIPNQGRPKSIQTNDNHFSTYLLQQLINCKSIDLKAYQTTNPIKEEHTKENKPIANTLSVLAQATTEGLLIEAINGPTANGLLGRFATEEPFYSIAKDLSNIETQSNPQILFVDIAYQAEGRTDNVNRRPQLYGSELTIGGWSTHPNPIQIEDILITVSQNQVYLYHNQTQQRIIPRFPSAYNTQRSQLPLYRMLADLNHQDNHNLQLPDLQTLFPNLDQYPRITYQDLIIRPAKWRMPQHIQQSKTQQELQNWLQNNHITKKIRTGQADQLLTFDTANETDLKYLHQYLQSQKANQDLYIQEAFDYPTNLLQDEHGHSYAHQQHLFFTNKETTYQPINQNIQTTPTHKHQIGNHWLYATIQIPENHQPNFLTNYIKPLIQSSTKNLDCWFYILYRDPEPQIRLRLKYKKNTLNETKHQIQQHIAQWENMDKAAGVQNIQFKAYQPETGRYGTNTLTKVEQFFRLDSELALQQYQNQKNEIETQKETLNWIISTTENAIQNPTAATEFLKRMADQFAKEMQWETSAYKQINQQYKNLSQQTQAANNNQPITTTKKTNTKTTKQHAIWQDLKNQHPKPTSLLADLIHMHVNRRFPNHPRVYEALLYQFAFKTQISKQKKQQNLQTA